MVLATSSAQADAELATRDRALGGLGVLLDDERLAAALDDALPGAGLRAAEATYVRYKPGTACIVACRLTLADQQLDAYVRLERRASYDKLSKHVRKAIAPSAVGRGAVLLASLPAALYPQPNDRRVAALSQLADDGRRRSLLTAALPEHPALWSARLQPLRWKPERRFVAALVGRDGARAVVKAYGDTYPAACHAATLLGGRTTPRTARCLGGARAARFVVLDWLAGTPLADDPLAGGGARSAGAALADLHAVPPPSLAPMTRDGELRRVLQSVDTVSRLTPDARGSALRLAQQIALRLPRDVRPVVAHGDFSADQVLIDGGRAALIDLDEAVLADPVRDLGSFAAALGREVVGGRLTAANAQAVQDALLAGYGPVDRTALRVWTATALLHLAPEPFRHREPDWPAGVHELLTMAEARLDG